MAIELVFAHSVDRGSRGVGADRNIERRGLIEAKHGNARRVQTVRLLHRAAGETAGPIVHWAGEITAVGGQISNPVSAADHGVTGYLVGDSEPRAPVVVNRVPK